MRLPDPFLPIVDVPKAYAKEYANETCLLTRNPLSGSWDEMTWAQFGSIVQRIAVSMVHTGVERGDRIAIFSENSELFLATYLASFEVGSIAIPFYASSSAAQVRMMLEHSETHLLFVGEQAQYHVAIEAISGMEQKVQLVLFDRTIERVGEDKESLYIEDFLRIAEGLGLEAELEKRREVWDLDDTALILYTSGTSGVPKGVQVSFRSVQWAITQHSIEIEEIKPGNVSMNFLPMTHIFEAMWCLLCLSMRVKIAINRNPKKILDSLAEVRPHYMCNVPRFWEKVYVGVYEKMQSFPPLLKMIADESLRVSRKFHFEYRAKGRKPPFWLKLQYGFYSRILLNRVKKKVGVERGLVFPTAGAALADKVHAFLLSIGVPIAYGYGLTETTATVCYCHLDGFEFGSIGLPLGGVEVKIDEQAGGEILVKGDTVTKGYYKAPEANAEAFTSDGWFRTGDLGSMDSDGNLFFKERAKDLFKTANGKYIAPNVIENLLTSDAFIEQAIVIADGRSFVSALIYPSWSLVTEELKKRGVENIPEKLEELSKLPEVHSILEERIDLQLAELASFEKVKKFYLLTESMSIDNGMLTNSLKTKRLVVEKYYEEAIRDLYSYHQLPDLTK